MSRHQSSNPPAGGRPELHSRWPYGPAKELRDAWHDPAELDRVGRAHLGSLWPRPVDIPGPPHVRVRDLRALLAGAEARSVYVRALGDALSRIGPVLIAVGLALLVARDGRWSLVVYFALGWGVGTVILGALFTAGLNDLDVRVIVEYRRALADLDGVDTTPPRPDVE